MKRYYIFRLVFCIFSFATFGQQNSIDSLQIILQNTKHDTTRLQLYLKLCDACNVKDNLKYAQPTLQLIDKLLAQTNNGKKRRILLKQKAFVYSIYEAFYDYKEDATKGLEYMQKSFSISQEIMDTVKIVEACMIINNYYSNMGNISKSLEYCQKGLAISSELKYKNGIATFLFLLGQMYNDQNDISQALENYQKCLSIYYELKDTSNAAETFKMMGMLYSKLHNIVKSQECFNKALSLQERIKNKFEVGSIYNHIGLMYKDNNDLQNALIYYQKSLLLFEEMNKKYAVSVLLNNIGHIYTQQACAISLDSNEYRESLFKKAIDLHFKALKNEEELHRSGEHYNNQGVFLSYGSLAETYLKQKKFKEAKYYSDLSLAFINKQPVLIEIVCAAELLGARIDSANGNYKDAYSHYQKYILLRDKLNSEEVSKASIKEKFQREFDKQKASAQAEQLKKDIIAAEEKRKQRIVIWSVASGLLLVLVFAGFIFRSLRVTRKQKQIIEEQKHQVDEAYEELNQQNEEIASQRDIVTHQKEQIERIHHEVSQSINYATRLQVAILPEPELLSQYLAEHFIIFNPKDKVSGDFYWWAKVEDHLIITVADCTGHGVPGAFMSMLGVSFLREIVVKEYIVSPAIILKRMRKEIIHALKQKGEYGEQKDGMDMALISINTETLEMLFSGANNPLYLIKNCMQENEKILEIIKPDQMPIAIYESMLSFTNHEFFLQKGDCLYIMSDGYQDQFGGPKRKKFLSKNLRELIAANSSKSMIDQKEIYENTINNWKGNLEQMDDITLMGIRL